MSEMKPHFPHGYSPQYAAALLCDALKAMDDLGTCNQGIVEPTLALARALADALETADLEGVKT